ncbi:MULTISPECIES: MlaC/ttg2D family ABC transporter substrate-binding protein [Azospira]|jgi:phospholipid transport system substrate-binding protein|uniref:ABC-type transport system involved in resistance to organic solvents, auxiliary component n=2 Tax=Azospira oryzae TaxID=146939 RepID=G8QN12_AZOOP|nr:MULTISPECIES: ABC transporter substrate-binding protein [Azospira]TLS19440.1 MAG: ABC transporter substrate-binding protein [Betaproteobacteria bacterium]AEV25797.1 ABC-type transport system involved in resistance to organic solvents, auxiliary component [Azospira oryzae PS]MBP7489717.1 ABC transporter substrate-binding protein [Azospira sp.]MDK9690751.1 ABC transporter substrate-binding protein [Azospira sp.]RZT75907.1 phospholipid transport system substrate-binding protein [Azospira oryza
MKAIRVLFTILSFGLLSAPVFADDMAPDVLVKKVTDEVLAVVRADKDLQNGNTKKAIDLVETKVLPHFNFTRMTALALGREWSKTSAEQKTRLTNEFRILLVRTYSNALTAYKDQTVEYKPFKMQAGETDVTVRTLVHQTNGKHIGLDYALDKQADGWKVYDVVVAGVSLVTNYRESFTQEIRANGVDGLISTLAAKNKGLEAAAAGKK